MRYERHLTFQRNLVRSAARASTCRAIKGQLLVLFVAVLPVGGCNSGTDLTPILVWPGKEPWVKGWMEAPIVVVGNVASVAVKGKNSIRRGAWSIEVRLHELEVDVENVIRGDIQQARVRVYRYGFFKGQAPGNMPVDDLFPGERRVLFLLQHDLDFRMIEDVVAGSFIVASGRHHPVSKDKTLNEQIAEVLVLPGEDFDESAYARTLEVQVSSKVLALVGFRRTVVLLRQLMRQGPNPVSAQACLSLYTLYPFGDSCIEALLHDPSKPAPVRERAFETARSYSGGKAKEMERFKMQPVEWFNAWVESEKGLSYVASSYKEDARFILAEMAQRGDDPVIQRNARMLLKDYVPTI